MYLCIYVFCICIMYVLEFNMKDHIKIWNIILLKFWSILKLYRVEIEFNLSLEELKSWIFLNIFL